MKELKLQGVFCAFGFLLLLIAAGCSSSGSGDTSDQPSQTGRASGDQVADSQPVVDSRLLGVWLGTATIDQQRLKSKMDTLSDAEREQIRAIVDSYLSTVMAMQFDDQGTVENDVEMKLNGRTIRETSVGVYRIVDRTDSALEIEVREQLQDGTQLTTRKTIRFGADGRTMEFEVPLGESLDGVGARLVFERQMLESVADSQNDADANVRR